MMRGNPMDFKKPSTPKENRRAKAAWKKQTGFFSGQGEKLVLVLLAVFALFFLMVVGKGIHNGLLPGMNAGQQIALVIRAVFQGGVVLVCVIGSWVATQAIMVGVAFVFKTGVSGVVKIFRKRFASKTVNADNHEENDHE